MIEVADIAWGAGSFRIDGISLTVPAGEYGVLMGRTGSGKTSLVELICGLRRLERGRITVGGRDVTNEPPGRRRIGYVPQDGALFPRLSVREQIGFAPRRRGMAAGAREELVRELAAATGVTHLLDRLPAGLSGGERQRIALARALAADPVALVLDEPLAALDEETHADMMSLLKSSQKRHALTVLHVTHHQHEAESLADVVLRLADGVVRVVSR